MFNFNLQQKAFEELSAEQFRVVYFLNNTLSMVNESNKTPDNNKIEMFNGYMMDKLGLSERQVQRLIKRLEQLDYITVERATRKNQPNIITINCDINGDKNVTLNKNTKENNNNITTGILEHKDLEPEVTKENKKYKIKNIKEKNNKKEKLPDQSSMDVKVSEPENKNLSLKKMKENEVSDTGTNVMNAISEQSERQAKENESSGCDKINEMTTSTQGNIITSNSGNGEHKVQSGKVINNCSIFTENCPKPYLTPQIPLSPLSSPNKATGDVETPSMEQLPTDELKTRQNAQECPQIEFDEKWYNETYALMNNLNTLEDLDKLYNRLKQNKNKRLIIDFNRIVWDSKSKVKENLKNRLAQMSADLERMTA